jgi:hypothetical protein
MVLTAMALRSTVILVVTRCSSKNERRFGGKYRLHLQNRTVHQSQPAKACNLRLSPTCTGVLLDLLLDCEDGEDIFLRNVGLFPKYAHLKSRRLYSWCKLSNVSENWTASVFRAEE